MLSQSAGDFPASARRPLHRPTVGVAVLIATLLLGGWLFGARAYHAHLQREQRVQTDVQLASYGHALNAALNRRFALLDGLAAFTLLHRTDPANLPARFADFAPALAASAPGILRLELRPLPAANPRALLHPTAAPLVYPPPDPARPLDRPLTPAELRLARAAAGILVGDPFWLDTVEVIPIYRLVTAEAVAADYLAILYLDAANLFAEAGLNHVPVALEVALQDDHGHILLGTPDVFAADPVAHPLSMPANAWRLAAIPRRGWNVTGSSAYLLFNLSAALIVLLIGGLGAAALRDTRRLEDQVAVRTQALTDVNRRLAEDVAARARAEAQIRRQLALFDGLYASTAELTQQLDFAARSELIAAACVARFGGRAAWLCRLQPDGQRQLLAAFPPEAPLPASDPLAAAAHAFPLLERDQSWGVLLVELPQPDPEALDALSTFAHLAAIALQNAELWRATQDHTAHLETAVAERTAELEAFTYTVSHDLRAPLRAMFGFAQALEEDYGPGLDGLGRDYLGRILGAAQRLDRLIQDLLAYSRLGRQTVSLHPLNLDSLLQDVLSQLEGALAEAGARVELAADLPGVRAHAPILTQALVNLVGNAARFVAPGVRPEIRIWAEARPGWVRLWVSDNGIGIAPEHQGRIFEVFERLHGIETYPGTGIGLAIVRRAAARLGGSCGVQSQPGQGSQFWIDLEAA
jgi:signal transduction histidine kinase